MQPILNFFTHIWLAVVDMMANWSPSSRAKAARVVAWLFWHVVPKRRKVALTNLKLCFPDWSESKREQVAKQCFFRLARAALDHSVLWKGSAEQVRQFVRFDDGVIERITNTENRPLIVIAPHFAGLDASGIALNLYVRGVSLYQRQTNPVWDKAAFDGRKRFSDPILIAKELITICVRLFARCEMVSRFTTCRIWITASEIAFLFLFSVFLQLRFRWLQDWPSSLRLRSLCLWLK